MWWLSAEEWIKGAAQVAAQVLSFFEAQQLEHDKQHANGAAAPSPAGRDVIADESQKACALSGEPFEEYWSDEQQEWMYKDTVRPDPNGPIYLVKALAKRQRSEGGDSNSTEGTPAKRQKR